MKINRFDTEKDVLVVAEIGNNHEGRFDVAQELVRRAAAAGVGAVKFQTFRAELFVGKKDEGRFQRLKSFELPPARFEKLAALAHKEGLLFISTPLDLPSVDGLAPFIDAYKISSGDNTFYPLMEKTARTGKPVIMSTGMCDMAEVQNSVSFLGGCRPGSVPASWLTVLHCVTSYPVPPDQANLRAIPALADALGFPVGYSDHTLGLDACLAAVALGARVVEKHFTLDKNFSDFRDHKISADPEELRLLAEKVKAMQALLGPGGKTVQACEQPFLATARRSICAARDLTAGRRLSMEDLVWLRPADGLPPGREVQFLGRVLKRRTPAGQPLSETDVE